MRWLTNSCATVRLALFLADNMLGIVSLPDAGTVTTALCQLSTTDCLLTVSSPFRVPVFLHPH